MGHVIPSLSYVVPSIHRCHVVARQLFAVHRPLAALSEILVLWLSTATVVSGQALVSDDVISMTTRHRSDAPSCSAVDRKQSCFKHVSVCNELIRKNHF